MVEMGDAFFSPKIEPLAFFFHAVSGGWSIPIRLHAMKLHRALGRRIWPLH